MSSPSGKWKAVTPQDTFSKVALAVAVPLIAGGIVALVHLSTEVALLKQELEAVASNKEKDAGQDSQLKRQWQHLSWIRGEINRLQAHAKLPITSPPSGDTP